MKKNLLLIILLFLFTAGVTSAVDSTKPSTHNSSWEQKHGQAAKTNMSYGNYTACATVGACS